MTAIFLIFFGILFYQLLIKPALDPSTSPNGNQSRSKAEQNEHLIRMWRNLREFKGEQKGERHTIKTKKAQRENTSNKQAEGFKGGEYIDYEEM